MSEKILEVSNLTVKFDQEEAIHNINFSIDKGDVLFILGPNGAGKTTLLRAILDLIPYQGTVKWYTKKIGYLPPQESLLKKNLPPLTIKDFFSFKSSNQNNIIAILQKVGLSKTILLKQFAALSTGQFQRMMLAWVLIDKPQVLLLDEPLTAIDIAGQEAIYSLIHNIWQEEGLTILLITHNISIIWKHATNVLCIDKKLICYGPPETTLTPELFKKMYGLEIALDEHRNIL